MSLKKAAGLNVISSVIDLFTTQIVALILQPVIVKALGANLFGIWKIIGQSTNYSNLADLRINQTLIWTLARNRLVYTEEEFRQNFSDAFYSLLLGLPVLMLVSVGIIWYVPYLTKVSGDYFLLVRLITFIVVFNFVINKFCSFFDSILKGMNMAYKRIGLRAFVTALSGGLVYAALALGYGIYGLATAYVISSLILLASLFYILKTNFTWFSLAGPSRKGIISYFKLTGYFVLSSSLKTISGNSELIILGYFTSLSVVTAYTFTKYLCTMVRSVVDTFIQAVKPSFSGYIGTGNFEAAANIRRNVLNVMMMVTVPLACIVIVFNYSFLKVWVDSAYYLGDTENLLIALTIFLKIIVYNEEGYIKASLDLKKLVVLNALSTAVFVVLSVILVRPFAVTGLCISILASDLVLLIIYPSVLSRFYGKSFSPNIAVLLKFSITAGLLFFLSFKLSADFNFFEMLSLGALTFIVLSTFIFRFLLTKKDRAEIVGLIKVFKK